MLAVSVIHALAPVPQPRATETRATPAPIATMPAPKRPYGVLHLDNLDIPAPEMNAFERSFVDTLITNGFTVSQVDASGWDNELDQANADIIRTAVGDVTVFAPDEPGHPLWLCPRGIAAVSGADVPTYEVSVGGDRINIQVEGLLYAGQADQVLVLTQTRAAWQQLSGVVAPVTCPG